MTPERMRQLAAEVVRGAAQCPPRLDVRDLLAGLERAGDLPWAGFADRERLVEEIHELASTAVVTVGWPGEATPVGGVAS